MKKTKHTPQADNACRLEGLLRDAIACAIEVGDYTLAQSLCAHAQTAKASVDKLLTLAANEREMIERCRGEGI